MLSRRAHAIESKLTAMGKDERAISVSTYVYRELVKYTDCAFHKTSIYKRHLRNHLLEQVESFRVGEKGSDREDDMFDTFCYGDPSSCRRRRRGRGPLCGTGNGGDRNRHHRTRQRRL
jgi:hypothetical protein